MLSPGQTIANKLRVVRRLGEGGMGVVYEAVQLHLSRRVAVKVIHPSEASSPEARTRFRREAKAQASLPLDHIVQVLDFDSLPDGSLYTVMEFLDGRDLKRELKKRGPLPVGEACAYVAQACRGAAVAHAAGIVHRDLKPRNIFITNLDGERRVKLLDFGVAKFLEAGGPDLTSTSVVLGTPTHLAPEQVDRAGEVDGRADIWALGVVLFELLTGQTPFRRDTTLATLAALSKDPPPPLASLRPDVSAELARIVERCLAKQPEERFQTADALGDALLPHALGFAGTVRPSQRVRRGSSAPPPAEGALPDSLSRVPRSVPTVAMPGAVKIRIEPVAEVVKGSLPSIPTEKVASGSALDVPAPMNGTTSDSPPPTSSRRPLALGALAVLAAIGLTLVMKRGDAPSMPSASTEMQPSSSKSAPTDLESAAPPSVAAGAKPLASVVKARPLPVASVEASQPVAPPRSSSPAAPLQVRPSQARTPVTPTPSPPAVPSDSVPLHL